MKLRNSPSILRIHSSKKKKGDEGVYSELLLFFHWRKESNLRKNCSDLFKNHYDAVKRNKTAIFPNSTMIDIIREMIENPEDSRPLHLFDMDTAGEQDNCDNEEILESVHEFISVAVGSVPGRVWYTIQTYIQISAYKRVYMWG